MCILKKTIVTYISLDSLLALLDNSGLLIDQYLCYVTIFNLLQLWFIYFNQWMLCIYVCPPSILRHRWQLDLHGTVLTNGQPPTMPVTISHDWDGRNNMRMVCHFKALTRQYGQTIIRTFQYPVGYIHIPKLDQYNKGFSKRILQVW